MLHSKVKRTETIKPDEKTARHCLWTNHCLPHKSQHTYSSKTIPGYHRKHHLYHHKGFQVCDMKGGPRIPTKGKCAHHHRNTPPT